MADLSRQMPATRLAEQTNCPFNYQQLCYLYRRRKENGVADTGALYKIGSKLMADIDGFERLIELKKDQARL